MYSLSCRTSTNIFHTPQPFISFFFFFGYLILKQSSHNDVRLGRSSTARPTTVAPYQLKVSVDRIKSRSTDGNAMPAMIYLFLSRCKKAKKKNLHVWIQSKANDSIYSLETMERERCQKRKQEKENSGSSLNYVCTLHLDSQRYVR